MVRIGSSCCVPVNMKGALLGMEARSGIVQVGNVTGMGGGGLVNGCFGMAPEVGAAGVNMGIWFGIELNGIDTGFLGVAVVGMGKG